jgi:hypothetical protein
LNFAPPALDGNGQAEYGYGQAEYGYGQAEYGYGQAEYGYGQAEYGYSQAEDRKRAEEASFDLHLVKPVDMGNGVVGRCDSYALTRLSLRTSQKENRCNGLLCHFETKSAAVQSTL